MDDLSLAKIDANSITKKTLKKVDGSIKKIVGQALMQFAKDPLYPSLNFEKITNTSILYSIRASSSIRIYLANYTGYLCTIVHIGNHDIPKGY
ncbi:MAG: hypothetical protein ABF420_06110 [Acetobacter syzygii]|uniref:hypothetical protein n=1 Tax=Acetobacter syzygii TaxID=146476 RepID=UPI0039E96ADD